jgi:hypothetical protein
MICLVCILDYFNLIFNRILRLCAGVRNKKNCTRVTLKCKHGDSLTQNSIKIIHSSLHKIIVNNYNIELVSKILLTIQTKIFKKVNYN